MRANPGCLVLVATLAAGCVSSGKYDQAVAQTETTRAELARANADRDKQRSEIVTLQHELEVAARDSDAIEEHLDELRLTRVAADARAAVFRDLAVRLQREVDAGDLAIAIRDQRMVLQVPNDVLFDSGKTDLKPVGKSTLESVAIALESLPNRHFQVAGHTDNEPIKKSGYTSNWELSSARALQVVHFLIKQGVAPTTLSAAGYGEVDPISTNDTPEGRKLNRRTEITILPDIQERVHVP